MHTIYTTEGIILKSINYGEANKYFFVFTKEFGLVKVAAQSVRHLKSKLRFSLEDFSLIQISFVRGKEILRLTSAEKKLKIKNKDRLLLWSRICSLLLRLLHGEERNELLFENVKEGISFLEKTDLAVDDLANFECLMALRVLSSLGYIGRLANFEPFLVSTNFTSELLLAMSPLKPQAILEINKSLQETHL
jgi:DNA repair protein RecO